MVSPMIQNTFGKMDLLGRPAGERLAVQRLTASALLLLVCLTGCLSPIALHRAVVEYDRTVSRVDAELLLLNIARARHHHPLHFTAVSTVAATFDFRTTAGLTGGFFDGLAEGVPFDVVKRFFRFNLGTEVAENPTVTIVPIQGEEFTKRVLAPLDEAKFEFLFHRGTDPALLLRLLAQGIAVDDRPGSDFPYLLSNNPSRPEEYREFRHIALHLSSLKQSNALYAQPLIWEEVWPLALDHAMTAQALERGYQWSQSRGGPPLLTKKVTGRVVVTNYNPIVLSDEERRRLHEEADRFPRDRVLIDIRQDYPGGSGALHGRILLRSLESTLAFLGHAIQETPEFNVEPEAPGGPIVRNPTSTLEVLETDAPLRNAAFTVQYGDRWYSITNPKDDTFQTWSLDAFRALYQVFQMTVTDVGKVPSVPITIAK